MIDRVKVNYHGKQIEVIYQPGTREMVFQTDLTVKTVTVYDHKTFNCITPEQWQQIKSSLASGCEKQYLLGE